MTANVDEYIDAFPGPVQEMLRQVRAAIHEAVPEAGEKISYGIPTATLDGKYLVYFAGWKNHISVYPVPAGDASLAADLAPYLTAKSTLKFPLNQEIPLALIKRVAARLRDDRVATA
jgi:uncharacterized protein YdhG (YjbR/CyaY superfamily)